MIITSTLPHEDSKQLTVSPEQYDKSYTVKILETPDDLSDTPGFSRAYTLRTLQQFTAQIQNTQTPSSTSRSNKCGKTQLAGGIVITLLYKF